MCRCPDIQVMGIGPSTFLLQHIIQCYKQVDMQNCIARVRVSYHPLCLVDVTVRTIVVHGCLAQLVLPVLL
jgi:hypothetical protein